MRRFRLDSLTDSGKFKNGLYKFIYHENSMIIPIANAIFENDFNIDQDRIYACGMSNGGYMSYELACELEDRIAAFGSVTGNFMLNQSSGQLCEFTREIPIIHFSYLVIPEIVPLF